MVRKVNRTEITCYLYFLLLVTYLCGCNSSWHKFNQATKRDLRELPSNLWQDNKDYLTKKQNLILLAAGGAASGYVRCNHDEEIDDYFIRHNHDTFSRDFNIAIGAIPLIQLSLTGAGYVSSVVSENEELYQVTRRMIEAQALNGIYTILFKTAAMDEGPNDKWMPAWPSGHVSISMTFASVLDEFYGPQIGWPLYALSGFVIYERMETRQHWASDVIFGAVLGYTVGKTVAGKYKPEIFGLEVMPYLDPQTNSTGILLGKRF